MNGIHSLHVFLTDDEWIALEKARYKFGLKLGYYRKIMSAQSSLPWRDYILMISGVVPKTPYCNLIIKRRTEKEIIECLVA